MHRRSTLFATAVCAALAVAPPLGAQDGPDDGMEEELTITLEPTNDSGIRGTAVLRDEPDAMGGPSHSVTLELTGLEPGGTYPAHVHSGTCATDGGVVTALVPVEAEGSAASATTILSPAQIAALQEAHAGMTEMARETEEEGEEDETEEATLFVQVHLSDGTPAACGEIPIMHGHDHGG